VWAYSVQFSGGRERGREGGREREKEREREGAGGREGGKEREREGGREGKSARERGADVGILFAVLGVVSVNDAVDLLELVRVPLHLQERDHYVRETTMPATPSHQPAK
jgi:hypothetical protein